MPQRPDTSLPPMRDAEWPEFLPGWVWLAGAGPGDPSLITLQVLNALKQADFIVYDALIDPRILDWAREDAEVEYAGKRGGKPSPNQRDISLRLIELARAGRKVLRLKGGDPFVFGRGGGGGAKPRACGDSDSHSAGDFGGDWRVGLCGDSPHPPRHQSSRHVFDRA